MAATLTTGASVPRVVFFMVPGDPNVHFATRYGTTYLAKNRWRGWRLTGVHNRRAGAALVAGNQSLRVRILKQVAEVAA